MGNGALEQIICVKPNMKDTFDVLTYHTASVIRRLSRRSDSYFCNSFSRDMTQGITLKLNFLNPKQM